MEEGHMKETARLFHLFSDETRLRILMLLAKEELFVCKIMAVLGVSQSLVSRNLAMLRDAAILEERKDGKLVHYSMKKDLHSPANTIIKVVKEQLKDDAVYQEDLAALEDCHRFQEKAGTCDMKTFQEFMEKKKAKKRGR
jgi:ArsR family transcriptional regulator